MLIDLQGFFKEGTSLCPPHARARMVDRDKGQSLFTKVFGPIDSPTTLCRQQKNVISCHFRPYVPGSDPLDPIILRPRFLFLVVERN
jgi:hypothetical protein